MSLSLIAVFLPILLMGGIIGRLFREFAVTLSVAILVSLVVSLSTTPMMCSRILVHRPESQRSSLYRSSERWFLAARSLYDHSLLAALRHPRLTMLVLLITVALNVALFIQVPKGFFPQQDTGRITGMVQADQSVSFQSMRDKMTAFTNIVKTDPAVDSVVGFTGGGQVNSGMIFIALKPLAERKVSADEVIGRLRGKLAQVAGASLFLQSVQDIRMGGRPTNAQYQYTLQSDDGGDLQVWAPKLTEALRHDAKLADVNSDQQVKGLETALIFDRDTAARLKLSARQIDNTLYDAFGQRQVSTIYNPLNQYHVIMEMAPQYLQSPDSLSQLWISTKGGTTTAISSGAAVSSGGETMIPLTEIARLTYGNAPLSVNHQGHFAAATLSFNLPVGVALSEAVEAIHAAGQRIGMPTSIRGSFQGTAKAFQDSNNNQPLLILAAIAAVYIVLGILYESTIHPVTILSTLPSAGVGAVLALMAFDTEFTIIALIGVILLIGIVKKNAIMMIDFAIEAERRDGLTPLQAIHHACLLRFRPIMMTTMVALLGALPLAFGTGEGSEMRRPLGIAIVGGLLVSQILTLYTTPVVYLYLDRFRLWTKGKRHSRLDGATSP